MCDQVLSTAGPQVEEMKQELIFSLHTQGENPFCRTPNVDHPLGIIKLNQCYNKIPLTRKKSDVALILLLRIS